MFNNTLKTLRGVLNDITRLLTVITVASQLITIGYFSYSSAVGNGYLPVNITLIAVSAVYLVLYLASKIRKENTRLKKVRKRARRITKAVKLTLKALTLSVTVYGIYLAGDADGISIILATLSIIFWIIQTLFEIIRYYGEIKFEELRESLRRDFEEIKAPAENVINAARNIKEVINDPIHHAGEIVNAVKLGAKGISKIKMLFKKQKAINNGVIYVDPEPECVTDNVGLEDAEDALVTAANIAESTKQ